MIKPQSLQRKFTLIYSGDPALTLPEDADERARVLKIARDTGQWESLIQPGSIPTLFTVKPLIGRSWDYFIGESNRRDRIPIEAMPLALRIALIDVENFGAHKVKRVDVEDADGVTIAHASIIDALYEEGGEHGRKIVEELGMYLYMRGKEQISPP